MFYVKFSEMLKCAGMVGSGMLVGAAFAGVAIQLPMLIQATWEGETKQLTFDSRTAQVCEVEEIAVEGINTGELHSQ